jgi:hypothetical protein
VTSICANLNDEIMVRSTIGLAPMPTPNAWSRRAYRKLIARSHYPGFEVAWAKAGLTSIARPASLKPLLRGFHLGGGGDATDFIVFAGDDDRLFAIGALQAQDAAVLHAAPADSDNDRENAKPEQDGHET